MAEKSNLQEFQTDWNKTVNWASQNKIPQAALTAVYGMDTTRLQQGEYPMSQAERTRAILGASNLDASSVQGIPSDTRSPTNVWDNAKTDLENIFTGLMPTKLVQNITDGIKNTFEHPSEIFNPQDNTIAQWIPGYQLLGEYENGGFSNVLSHPIISLLNVLPLADGATSVLGKTALGDRIASNIGMTGDQLADSGPLRLAGKAIKAIPTGKAGFIQDPETGILTPSKSLTVGERLHNYALAHQMSHTQAELAAGMSTVNAAKTLLAKSLYGPFFNAAKDLTDDEALQLSNLLTKSGKPYRELLDDPSIPVKMKNVLKAYEQIETMANEWVLSSVDGAQMVTMPDGREELYVNQGANPVVLARQKWNDLAAKLAKAAEKSDATAIAIARADAQANPIFTHLVSLRNQLSSDISGFLAGRGKLALTADPIVTAHLTNMLDDMFSPGGLVEQLQLAMDRDDTKLMRAIIGKIRRKFANKSLANLGPQLAAVKEDADQLYAYTKYRARMEDKYTKEYEGLLSRDFKGSTKTLQKQTQEAENQFKRQVIKHPPAKSKPLYLELFVKNLLAHEKGAEALDKAASILSKKTGNKLTVTQIREDPRLIAELITVHAKASSEDPLAGVINPDMAREIAASAKTELARLLAQGFTPHWVPNVSAAVKEATGTYNIFIPTTRLGTVDAAFDRLFDFTSTIYDVKLAVNHFMGQTLARDGGLDYLDTYVDQFLLNSSDLISLIDREYPQEMLAAHATGSASAEAFYNHVLTDIFHLEKFDPKAIFGLTKAKVSKDAQYISKDLAETLRRISSKDQFGGKGAYATGTKIFRTSVLGYSPRFIAHIIFGGSFLVALRASPLVFKFLPDAYRMVKEGTDPVLRGRDTQYGTEADIQYKTIEGFDQAFNKAGGKQLGNMWIQHMMEKLGLDPSQLSSWLQAIPQVTFKLTNFVTNMQRAVVMLDGEAKAARQGWILDETGHRIEITPERARVEGMRAAVRTMGDLREMSPFEQEVLVKIMPFYGWTKHILKYVASYPMDHPYRAMFLSNLANMNSEGVPSGLATRIQLLFFLGQPSADGSVTAIDARALDPLRDVANYASWSGILSALNPALTAIPAIVDPNIIFGTNVLYPNVTYNTLYGTTQASASGNLFTAAEQYVPEIGALDAALQLSSQYRNLRRSDPTAYINAITTALGLPFTPETINVKQMAAQNTIKRYHQAADAASQAWSSATSGQQLEQMLAGYPTVPDPLNPDYSITPAQLAAQYDALLKQTGAPPSEVAVPLPSPAY